jgi:hypothetical protein
MGVSFAVNSSARHDGLNIEQAEWAGCREWPKQFEQLDGD